MAPSLLALWVLAGATPPTTAAVEAAQTVRSDRVVRAITALQAVPGASRVTSTPGAAAARAWVLAELAAMGVGAERWPFTVGHTFDGGRRWPAVNLVARLGPAEGAALVLVAHLDSKAAEDAADAADKGWRWREDPAPGADDDASGVAALLEVARALAPRQSELRRPVVVAFTDAEELAKIADDGFMEDFGAEALARELGRRGVSVAAALAVDMLAKPRPYGYLLRLYEDGRIGSAALAQTFGLVSAVVAPELVVDRRLAPGFTYSDHGAFWAEGQAGLLLIEDDFHHPRYHQVTDRLEAGAGYDVEQVVAATRALAALCMIY